MPRQNRRRPAVPLRGVRGADARRDTFTGRDYLVRAVTGTAAVKAYRCPGCLQEIPPARPHVVVWPDDPGGADERRHWHTGCWSARHRR